MMRPHVVKLGGSLLANPRTPTAMANWLRRRRNASPESHLVIVVGGGEPVDWLRRLDSLTPLGEQEAHWAAIQMMDANARAVSSWWPEAEFTEDWRRLKDRVQKPGVSMLATSVFLRDIEPELPGIRLPIGWQVTSDSIAARVAVLLQAGLTLLKSRPVETPEALEDWQRLANSGILDQFFPQIVGELNEAELAILF